VSGEKKSVQNRTSKPSHRANDTGSIAASFCYEEMLSELEAIVAEAESGWRKKTKQRNRSPGLKTGAFFVGLAEKLA
jgi:hypothetical protein